MSSSTLIRILAVALVLGLCTGLCSASELPPPDADAAALQQAGQGSTNDELLAFLKARSANDADLAQTERLVKQLGSSVFSERQEASRRLIALGTAALQALQAAPRDNDPEVAKRVEACVKAIESASRNELAAVRLLGRRAPEGAAGALLRFVPYAAEEHLEETVWFTLDVLARKEGQIDGSFEAALQDRLGQRRAAAAFTLARYGKAQQQAAAAKFLEDPDPRVRLRAAQGLLGAKDKRGLPALLRLLGEEDLSLAWQAEELLRWAVAEGSPHETLQAGGAEGREKCRKAWQAWWDWNGGAFDLSKRHEDWQRPGLVLLCDPGKGWEEGCVWLSGCDGVTRCQWERLRSPVEARLIPGPRVLIAEAPAVLQHNPPTPPPDLPVRGRITERDPDGKVRWECDKFPDPVDCRRLLNGNTMIVTKGLDGGEVSPGGEPVAAIGRDIFSGAKPSPRPTYCGLTSEGRLLVAMDEETWRVRGLSDCDPLQGGVNNTFWNDALVPLPSFSAEEAGPGRYLVSGTEKGKVFEVENGWSRRDVPSFTKTAWKQKLPGSTNAVKLPTGQIFVAVGGRVVTLDRDGKTVGELLCERPAFRVRPCLSLVRLGFDAPAPLIGIYQDAEVLYWLVEGTHDALVAHRLRGLKSDKPLVRRRSAELIGELGPKGAEAIPALEVTLRDPDEAVRRAA
ncbi:MAG TPA: HEAT repeat domain-containing protein, partial [Gemmataceae bacterium]|nr:HEAT repeat domain-containing protein [Gemmataceae bacterium]